MASPLEFDRKARKFVLESGGNGIVGAFLTSFIMEEDVGSLFFVTKASRVV